MNKLKWWKGFVGVWTATRNIRNHVSLCNVFYFSISDYTKQISMRYGSLDYHKCEMLYLFIVIFENILSTKNQNNLKRKLFSADFSCLLYICVLKTYSKTHIQAMLELWNWLNDISAQADTNKPVADFVWSMSYLAVFSNKPWEACALVVVVLVFGHTSCLVHTRITGAGTLFQH